MNKVAALVLFFLFAGGCARYTGTPHEVTIVSSDGVRLSGTLVVPEEQARGLPGVVLLHGAEPATRSFAYRLHANIFLERGMAVLLYDKRGAGQSGGNHDAATYGQLVEDALAAVRLIREHPGTHPGKIGIVGASESGWFTPEIAARDGQLAFVINKVGPCLSWRRTVAWEIYHDLLAEGVSEASASAQTQVYKRLWAYYLDPTSAERQALENTLHEWSSRDDSQLPTTLRLVDSAYVQTISYDPAPFLEQLTTPVLYVYGSEDVNVPTDECVTRLSQLRDAGRPVSFHVFEDEGHELGGIGLSGYQFADGYAELLGNFAAMHTETGARATETADRPALE